MHIALTGATGFLGRYIADALLSAGHTMRCWTRLASDRSYFAHKPIDWVEGTLGEDLGTTKLVQGCDALVHAALWRPGAGFRGAEGDLEKFAERNVIGSLKLFQAAAEVGLKKVVYVSSCAVHEKILSDRPLDETHPTWSKSHYGAHKAAVEAFVHSFAMGHGLPICAIRPTGIYGIASPIENSKWYPLVKDIVQNKDVSCTTGGKEVHASDVAKAIGLLLKNDEVGGEIYACYDRYISNFEVASLAKEMSGSRSQIDGEAKTPKNQIATGKIRSVGMEFGGETLLRQTIETLLNYARRQNSNATNV